MQSYWKAVIYLGEQVRIHRTGATIPDILHKISLIHRQGATKIIVEYWEKGQLTRRFDITHFVKEQVAS